MWLVFCVTNRACYEADPVLLPLTLITCYMPSVPIRATVNVHCYSRCVSAFFGDDAGFGFGKIKILFFTVLTTAKTHSTYLPSSL